MVKSSVPGTIHRVFHDELSDLLDFVLAGDVVADRAVAERLVRVLGAIVTVHEQHPIDAQGKCPRCWAMPRRWWGWWPWPKRSTCSVYEALCFFLRQPTQTVLAVIET